MTDLKILPAQAAPTPRSLWIELTSKCALDCVFCSRKLRRGAGQHLPFPVFERLLRSLVDPRRLMLNYSGESTHYPDLIPAIQLARSTGAYVELVSVLTPLSEEMLPRLAASGLNRLTVSVHATDPALYFGIYRYGSFAALRSRLERFLAICSGLPNPPIVDLAFVAMDRNLAELTAVAELAHDLGLRDVMVFPIQRRDPIPETFTVELDPSGIAKPGFRARLDQQLAATQRARPEISLTLCNPLPGGDPPRLGQVPISYPWPLPAGGAIHSCEQNPWDTAHVLANGDVVACEVLDRKSLGNLLTQDIAEIWNGPLYREFRARYLRAEGAECRNCAWKTAYRPSEWHSAIHAERGGSAQLVHGWHDPEGQEHIWSTQRASAVLAPLRSSQSFHVSGLLPPGRDGQPNELAIQCNGRPVGVVSNPYDEIMPFGLDFSPVQPGLGPWVLDFRTTQIYRPSEHAAGSDQRDLGFAMVLLASKPHLDPDLYRRSRQFLAPVEEWIHRVDRFAQLAARALPARRTSARLEAQPGLTVVIPERGNPAGLAECLRSVGIAASLLSEPVQAVVVVNGTPPEAYAQLRSQAPEAQWLFHRRPLGFSRAVFAGLRAARHAWVYLLNSDAILEPEALAAAAAHRDANTFAIASQIILGDATRFREETNWCDISDDNGLVALADRIPHSAATVEGFYAGGGASLFQRRVLLDLLDFESYPDFYWEDVEWGWRARKLGYRILFSPDSIVHHEQGVTVKRYFTRDQIEAMWLRNQALFQLRNWVTAGTLEGVLDLLARAPEDVARSFTSPRMKWRIARGRWWSHRTALSDEEVLGSWRRYISTC
ncbi:glycosyltransferase [Paludibaculum fermentans]|uniref:Glycosyltransferase n=1 Tax=Paludibaculum fermentans TaxID=1473598 RepID=A0A7S7NYZ1_PALFE|nr:glycosyltransferase [Paludibaculum fermentans]QOY91829.1 glycosyltransferase [Paludibaculum fermentans]